MREKMTAVLLALCLLPLLACCGGKPEGVPAPAPSGSLLAGFADEVDEEQFEQLIRVVLDEGGDEIALRTDGLLKNVRVERGSMDMDGVKFLPDYEVFRADWLDARTLLVIRTYFTDTVPTLRISFEGAEGENWFYLFQSGRDGSILLTKD